MYGDTLNSTLYLPKNVIEAFSKLKQFFFDLNAYAYSMYSRDDLPQKHYFTYELSREGDLGLDAASFGSVLMTVLLNLAILDGVFSLKEITFINEVQSMLQWDAKILTLNPKYFNNGLFRDVCHLDSEKQNQYVESINVGTINGRGLCFYKNCAAYDFFKNRNSDRGYLSVIFDSTSVICNYFVNLDGVAGDYEYEVFIKAFDKIIAQPLIKHVHDIERKIK